MRHKMIEATQPRETRSEQCYCTASVAVWHFHSIINSSLLSPWDCACQCVHVCIMMEQTEVLYWYARFACSAKASAVEETVGLFIPSEEILHWYIPINHIKLQEKHVVCVCESVCWEDCSSSLYSKLESHVWLCVTYVKNRGLTSSFWVIPISWQEESSPKEDVTYASIDLSNTKTSGGVRGSTQDDCDYAIVNIPAGLQPKPEPESDLSSEEECADNYVLMS